MKVLNYIVVLVCSFSGALQSMVSHSFLVSPEGKHVLILAELHKLSSDLVTQNFISRLALMKSADLSKPIPFILEMEDGVAFDDDMECSVSLKVLLSLRKTQDELEKKQLAIEFFDPRGEYSREIDVLMFSLGKSLIKEFPQEKIEQYYKGVPLSRALMKKLDQIWRSESILFKDLVYSRPVTVGEYLTYLHRIELELIRLVQNCTDEIVKKTCEKYSDQYKAAHQECVRVFEQSSATSSLGVALTQVLDSSADTGSRLTHYHELTRIFKLDTDHLYFELFLLERLMKRLKTDPVVCVYVGYNHAKKLDTLLLDCGYTIRDKESAVEFGHPLLTSVLPNLVPNLLPKAVLDSFLEPITKEACWFCKKKPEALKQCAYCKKAKYCDRTCQTYHWKEHKTTCVKVVDSVSLTC